MSNITPSRGLASHAETMVKTGRWKSDRQKAAEQRRHLGVPARCQDCRDGIHAHRGPMGCLEVVGSPDTYPPRDFVCQCMKQEEVA
ncbi:MAG TPA: hypothetical protein PLB01_00295 [Thermoanaerobaculia bacterium]|nr:hypothetical protein [Thermoanaerobaculia bacterium]